MEDLSRIINTPKKNIQYLRNTFQLRVVFKNRHIGNCPCTSPRRFYPDPQNKIIKLLQSGCNIHYRFEDGATFLHYAIENEWNHVTQLLIENGLDVNCQTLGGLTPLHLACQYGLEDEIWMLLFCGADPNIANFHDESLGGDVDTCFDIVAFDRSLNPSYIHIQEIFFDHFNADEKNFSCETLVDSLTGVAIPFPKLMELASNINLSTYYWSNFCELIEHHPDFFKLFVQKFAYLLEDSFKLEEVRLLDCRYERNLETYPKILLTLFESTAVSTVVDHVRAKRLCLVNVIIHMFDDTETITQLLCCMLSHGVDINALAMNQIYFKFGYCDLFRMMLHMDLSEDWDCGSVDGYMGVVATTVKPLMGPIVPQIIYDLDMSVPLAIQSFVSAISCLAHTDNQYTKKIICEVFAHFALPESVKGAIFDLDPCASLFNSNEYKAFMDEGKFPVVPTLIELCRGGTREYIIKKYQTKNCSQFYTVLKILPISTVYKKIISFETKLYPIDKSHLF